jgi:hypothetical protein
VGYRLGSAFILLGLILLTIFLVTFSAEQEDPLMLMAGAGLSVIGLALRRHFAARAASARFRTLRRLLGSEQREEE